jgi:glucosamine-6-phosphate deaminase
MKVLIFRTKAEATERAGDLIAQTVMSNPSCTLGLATGGTMEPLYAGLRARNDTLDCSRVTTFNLDEYVGLSPSHPQSYHAYMTEQLFDHLNFKPSNTHLPVGDVSDPEDEANRYESLVRKSGGIDLQLLGIGTNGHIGFNEPCSSLGSRTRLKTLTSATRDANARFFDDEEMVPRYAITMGIKTILDAKEIVVLATGPNKAAACHKMIEGPISAYWPASVLQFHPNVTALLDEDAAADLELRDYLETVHPAGKDVKLV